MARHNRDSAIQPAHVGAARDLLSGLDEHNLGDALQGLEFSVEGDAADAIDAGDASPPNKAEHEFRAVDECEGLSNHNATSLPCGDGQGRRQVHG